MLEGQKQLLCTKQKPETVMRNVGDLSE